jgi:hypothetical protein
MMLFGQLGGLVLLVFAVYLLCAMFLTCVTFVDPHSNSEREVAFYRCGKGILKWLRD